MGMTNNDPYRCISKLNNKYIAKGTTKAIPIILNKKPQNPESFQKLL